MLLSVYEHNANLIPWRESGAKIEIIPMTEDGCLDFDYLEKILIQYKDYNALKVGTFSAGSNITGQLNDVDRISVICH